MERTEKIWHLIAKALNREISPSEYEEMVAILAADAGLAQQYELLTRIWNEKQHDNDDTKEAEEAIEKIIGRAGPLQEDDSRVYNTEEAMPVRRRRRRVIRIASLSGIAAVITGLLAWYFLTPTLVASGTATSAEVSEQYLSTQNGSRSRYLLPDGTTVWLNAGSRIVYENDFTGKTREVRLEGEAYFDVAHQPDKPFIVHTSGYNIKVLGTVFNVKAYPEDKTIETTLFRGSVKVFRQQDPESAAINLVPNQKLLVPRIDGAVAATTEPAVKAAAKIPETFRIIPIDSTKEEAERFETAWLFSRLEFRGDDFETLARKMERWYNITITFSDDKVKQLHFNGSFEKETAEQALWALRTAVPFFNYTTMNNRNHEIIVSSATK
ncbi:MAG: FecR family protein [Chitinophagaceae bacterium]|nr:MAG: FecR family protein [Chitinophagaceae bacterium]